MSKHVHIYLGRKPVVRTSDAGKYYTCPECEANFQASALVGGKLPSHKFQGKPCPGSGETPTTDRRTRDAVSSIGDITSDAKATCEQLIARLRSAGQNPGAAERYVEDAMTVYRNLGEILKRADRWASLNSAEG